MNCSKNQCCAPLGNSRCTNFANESKYCDLHRDRAISLYRKYKNLENSINTINLNKSFQKPKEHIDYILNCYNTLNKMYKARMKHRKYAITPELYDTGHDYQLTRLENLMLECENLLSNLYKLYDEQIHQGGVLTTQSECRSEGEQSNFNKELYNNVLYRLEGEKENYTCKELVLYNPKLHRTSFQNNKLLKENYIPEDESIPNRINKCKKYRKNIEDDINEYFDLFISLNKQLLKNREILATKLEKFIKKLFDENANNISNISDVLKCIIIYKLCGDLYEIDYFNEEFIPEMCPFPCTCGNFESYDVLFGCNCTRTKETPREYFNIPSESTLKLFYELLLLNSSKILVFIPEIALLYRIYGDKLIYMRLKLIWYPLLNRYKLEEDMSLLGEKTSKMMSVRRLKDKFYFKKLREMEILRDIDDIDID
jgi:hypothetical protein